MNAGSSHRYTHEGRATRGGVVVLRLVILWSLSVLALVSFGESARMVTVTYAPMLRATAAGLTVACSALSSAGIHSVGDLLRLA